MKDLKDYLSRKMGPPSEKPNKLKQEAKSNVLNDFKDAAKEQMAESLGPSMKKVSVMAKDTEGLERGLDKAKALVEEMPEGDDPTELADELLDDPSMEHATSSKDEEIAKLREQLEKMQEALSKLQG